MRPKHVPFRSCVICRAKLLKRELTRVVRTPQGIVQVDPTGKQNGRGTYLCRNSRCWEQALKKSRLDYALRGRISPSDKERLRAYAGSLACPSDEAG